ncbi:MAG: hypothetical protein JNK82_14100 [Myxococcaceae bacterium]|nr:hypothetical protein [Myxococcaceae bacterium]
MLLAAVLALGLTATGAGDEDAGAAAEADLPPALAAPGEEPPVPAHYDSAPLKLDGRVIDFLPDAGVKPPEPSWLKIRGNKVLPDEMYRNALQFPEGTEPDAATAAYIEETLYGFLVKSGYELATVGAVLTKDGIDVQIDEGQLEKVVFTGRLTFNTLRFRLELFIDQEVFNRPALERQLARLSERIGLKLVRWSLVPTPNPDHIGPQIESIGTIEGFQILHARKRYELWFFFEEKEWDTGVGLDLRSGYIDGLEIGLNYQGIGKWDDRWRVSASGGLGLRYRIEDHGLYPWFSRAMAEGQWHSRKFWGRARLGGILNATLVNRQRIDLDVEKFFQASSFLQAQLSFEFGSAHIIPAFGVQWRRAFGIEPTPNWDPRAIPPNNHRLRAYFDLAADWVIDPENQRWDRQHKVLLNGRYYFGRALDPFTSPFDGQLTSYAWFQFYYQKIFEFGWHDLWLRTRGRMQFGDILFDDEEAVAEVLRGVFNRSFMRKGGHVDVEFRFSLNRDVLKLSFFTEVALYGEVCRLTDPTPADAGACRLVKKDDEVLRLGISAGPGLHALIQGMFQMDLYATIGWRTRSQELGDQMFAFGVTAFLNKTF